jgi:hypothetical protein
MKKNLLFSLVLTLLASSGLIAQTYDSISPVYTFSSGPDTVYHQFTNCPANPIEDGILTISADGDFDSSNEYFMIIGDDTVNLGNQYEPPSGLQCPGFLDSLQIIIPLDTLNSWVADGVVDIWFTTSSDVDPLCANNQVQFQLTYEWCPFGIPVEYAAINDSLIPDICANGSLDLSTFATPSGGIFSGNGITGSTLDAQLISDPSTEFLYTYTDSIGCVTVASASVTFINVPELEDATICPDSSVLLGDGFCFFNWYANDTTGTLLTSGISAPSPPLTQTTTYFMELLPTLQDFTIDTLTADNFVQVDHDALTGDDRGGIAVTPNYVYVVGDNNTARYDLDLTPASGISLPLRDGIFSDLGSGRLFSLYSSALNNAPGYNTSGGVVDQLVVMDENLNFTSTFIELSDPINMNSVGNNNNGIFAGYGMVILYSDIDATWHKIDLCSGQVENLGGLATTEFYYSENWSDWGIAEYDGTNYSVIYRDYLGSDIKRRVLPNGTPTIVGGFSDLSDLSSLTYSPWNNRWYCHFEGGSQFSGISETLLYADASHTLGTATIGSGSGSGCRGSVTYYVDQIDLGPDTAICADEEILLTADLGYTSYTWNGSNTNLNSFVADTDGEYVLEAINTSNCVIKDTMNLVVNPLPVVNLGGAFLLCNDAIDTLDAGAGFNSYNWSSGDTTSMVILDGAALGNGTYDYEVIVTDANGCEGEDNVFVVVEACVGIGELENQAHVTLAPNPNNGQFSLTIEGYEGMETMSLKILNMVGQAVYEENIQGSTFIKKQFNIGEHPAGFYFVNIQSENTNWMQKIIKQ